MELKIGDLVAFKKYEDMTDELKSVIAKESFPEFGKVSTVYDAIDCFEIEDEQYVFGQDLIDYIIVKGATGKINVGDEVLMKVTIRKINGNHVSVSWVNNNKGNIVKVLKRKEPDHFIVQEDYYGMYIGVDGELVPDKIDAKIYTSRDTANADAADMHLNAWEVTPYDD
jgi:hypothetical protein